MKRSLVIAATAMVVFGGLSYTYWYGRQQIDNQMPQYQYTQVKLSQRHPLSTISGSPACNISINLESVKSPFNAASSNINQTISQKLFEQKADLNKQAKAYTQQYIQRYVADIAPLYAQEDQSAHVEGWYNYSFKAEGKFENGCFGVLNYLALTTDYQGGAHSVPMNTYLNFDKKTGALLTPDSIYIDGYEKKLNELLLEALLDKLHLSKRQELTALGYLSTTDIYPPTNYLLKEDGILYYYNVYEIAPFDIGSTQFTISYSKLDELLRPEFKSKYSGSSIKRVFKYYTSK